LTWLLKYWWCISGDSVWVVLQDLKNRMNIVYGEMKSMEQALLGRKREWDVHSSNQTADVSSTAAYVTNERKIGWEWMIEYIGLTAVASLVDNIEGLAVNVNNCVRKCVCLWPEEFSQIWTHVHSIGPQMWPIRMTVTRLSGLNGVLWQIVITTTITTIAIFIIISIVRVTNLVISDCNLIKYVLPNGLRCIKGGLTDFSSFATYIW